MEDFNDYLKSRDNEDEQKNVGAAPEPPVSDQPNPFEQAPPAGDTPAVNPFEAEPIKEVPAEPEPTPYTPPAPTENFSYTPPAEPNPFSTPAPETQPADQGTPSATPQEPLQPPIYGQPTYGTQPTAPQTPPAAPQQPPYGTQGNYTPPGQGPVYQGSYTPNYNAYQKEPNGLAIASLITGIISVLTICFGWVSIICAIAAIVLGIMGRKKSKNGMALAGLIIGIVALVIWVFVLIVGIFAAAGAISSGYYYDFYDAFDYYFDF